ncbi:hypothetical protein GLOTRDRAFT_94567 [Gloeophyllum trabeum ATCC 11539]|uniref:Luciferase domain-containing protein n=1 Tax=Gloeophyllum trabeum (strain ATCC 11539 / FP-39264 / Madison 617) TaxID=670483 RepID=S7Q437_GLOTA|nr:uncharacterized protein GLOTRDRAFT_94567 [Gloeophyllum trabeum ATCC 11539]EPQ54233.1 hypothetical protein GLOTRDRAFT_94567 [Gloeophyllum trabeum ATCC 11539]
MKSNAGMDVHTVLDDSPIYRRTSLAVIPALCVAGAFTILLHRNYQAYLSLGPGGLPLNPWGWLISTLVKPLGRETLSTTEYDGADSFESCLGESSSIPYRSGPRPRTGWHFLPQRQLDQIPDEAVKQKLRELMDRLAKEYEKTVAVMPSPHEKVDNALIIRGTPPHKIASDAQSEILHLHASSDFSVHAILSSRDCKLVIERGWGERHPLSGVLGNVPRQFLMVYAPRNDEEFAVVERILKASIEYMTKRHSNS